MNRTRDTDERATVPTVTPSRYYAGSSTTASAFNRTFRPLPWARRIALRFYGICGLLGEFVHSRKLVSTIESSTMGGSDTRGPHLDIGTGRSRCGGGKPIVGGGGDAPTIQNCHQSDSK